MDLTKICEYDPSSKPAIPPFLEHIDWDKALLRGEEKARKIREQLPKGSNYSMRSEAKRLRSFVGLYQDFSTWCPKEMASAGFFCTELESSVQCFCCGLVLCKASITYKPLERHRHFNPHCEFVKGGNSGNILKYEIHPRPMKCAQLDCKESMKSEQARLQSFSSWPPYSLIEHSTLAQAGFYFTGPRDTSQCFSCGGCLGIWEAHDDPWKEHAKWFPECEFLKSKKSQDEIQQYIQNELRFNGTMGEQLMDFVDPETVSFSGTTYGQALLFEKIKILRKQLIEKYTDPMFHKVSPFGDSVSIALDVLFADITIVLKDTKNQPVRQLILPEVLSELRDITMIEGEFGSGKSALLKKIAILWASGKCPILSRFDLVFFISLSSTDNQQSLSDIICQQLRRSTESLTEDNLDDIMKLLKDKALFLMDDYGIMDSVPGVEGLMEKNFCNQVTITITVNTNKSQKVRPYARTILSIGKFPLYSTLYLVKNIFPNEMQYVKEFVTKLQVQENVPKILQTPLMILTQCSSKLQNPSDTFSTFSDTNLFKTYIKYGMLKFPAETEAVMSQMLLCGEMALKGLFQSQFQFSENDLKAAAVNGDKAIKYGLLSKFTAQRLQPIYRFFDPSFQEFLAGKRLSELLESEKPEDLDKGLYYLHQVNTYLKLIGPYSYLIKYASSISPAATVKMLSYLFSLHDNPAALNCHLENREHLKQHLELDLEEEMFILSLRKQIRLNSSSVCLDRLMTVAVEAATDCQGLPDCAPVIIQFLTGKTVTFSIRSVFFPTRSTLTFIEKFPESITVMRSFDLIIHNSSEQYRGLDISQLEVFIPYGAPTVESDYSSAFLSLDEQIHNDEKKWNVANQFFKMLPEQIKISDAIIRPFLMLGGHKVPKFRLTANFINSNNFSTHEFQKLCVFFSISDNIELVLNSCEDFVRPIGSAIESFAGSFKALSFNNMYLTKEEQDSVLAMSSLESLEIGNSLGTNYPENLIRGIHKFSEMTEVFIDLPENPEVLDHLPDEFQSLHRMKKIVFLSNNYEIKPTRFVLFLRSFENLECLYLGLNNVDCNDLMNSLVNCKKLKELDLHRSSLQENNLAALATGIKDFTSLKYLNLSGLKVAENGTAENLAFALGSLTQLEKLWLPAGQGMAHAAKLIIEQFQNLPNLQFLSMFEILDDESIVLLGAATKNGCLENIQQLDLQSNDTITESGWATFFETAECMPELSHLNISRAYTQQIKSHPTTVTSFVQFVSRLPRLLLIRMFGWLLDKDDLDMFEAMKKSHPQAQSLTISWQWILPFSTIIEN